MRIHIRSILPALGVLLASALLAIPTLLAPLPGIGAFAQPQSAFAAGEHAGLTWGDYPSTCRGCHADEFADAYQGVHYQWQGVASDNTNKAGTLQGKAGKAMNAYCISTLGNWMTCGKCHAGRGATPVWTLTPSPQQLDNIDCLMCHNEAYAMARVRLVDGTMGPAAGTPQATLDGYVRNIAKPKRANCLKCHAFAGGGDGVKRGDLSAVQTNTADANLDVHMATTRGNLACQACHTFVNHKVTGKGSDLEATDYAAEVKCATASCHPAMQTGGHATAAVNSHIAHVACQTCHVPVYGKVATEVSRDWRTAVGVTGAFKPTETKGSNLVPVYKWWNRKTNNYLMGDSAVLDPATGAYSMERLQGSAAGDTTNKLYPFKYKVAFQPMRTQGNILIALDTSEYLNVSGSYSLAVQKGLLNMGFGSGDAYTTVKTDTYQLLNHTIADAQSAGGVLVCADCHENTARLDLTGQLGYGLKAPMATTCSQGEARGCHNPESWPGYSAGHRKHVTSEKLDCINCHTFSRPERGLKGAVAYPPNPQDPGVVNPGGVNPGSGTTPVYRFYNKRNGSHFYTASETEKHSVVEELSKTYSLDGVAYRVLSSYPTPLYRFYNKTNGSHFYTASEAEKARVMSKLSKTYSYDGPAYNVSAGPMPGSVPVYRFYNKQNGSHFYTASEAEKSRVQGRLSATYQLDGIAFYVAP